MIFKFLKIIGIGFILSVSTLTNATLIDNGDYTTDTESGLDWLDWTETLDDTQAEALLEFSGDGWRIASASEAHDLIENHFGVSFAIGGSLFGHSIPDQAIKLASFHSLFGCTDICSNTYGFSAATIVNAGIFGAEYWGTTPAESKVFSSNSPLAYGLPTYHSEGSGVALVKATTVSEPTIITIFALGFAGIGFARRRQS